MVLMGLVKVFREISAIVFAGKPKMISLGLYPTITLADSRSRRDDAQKHLH